MRNSMLFFTLLLFPLACGGAAPPAEAPTDEQPAPVGEPDPTKDVAPPTELPESPTASSTPAGFAPKSESDADTVPAK